jgi:hypothetical protein
LKLVEHPRYLWIRRGLVCPSPAVFFGYSSGDRSNILLAAARRRQRTLGKSISAFADKIAIRVNWVRRKAETPKRGVCGIGKVGKRIEQSAIKVEDNSLKLDCCAPLL